jgi:hypothetical protein
MTFRAALVVAAFLCGACSPAADSPAAPPAAAPAAPVADQWIGQWTGPEGTFLKIGAGGGRYDLTIQNLDGPRTFSGLATERGISFERDGVREEIRATNGEATGMKWLKDKTDCLTVKPGEGYCRR